MCVRVCQSESVSVKERDYERVREYESLCENVRV